MRLDDTSAKRLVVQCTGNAHAWNFMHMRTVFTACTTHRRCFSSPTRLYLLNLWCVMIRALPPGFALSGRCWALPSGVRPATVLALDIVVR